MDNTHTEGPSDARPPYKGALVGGQCGSREAGKVHVVSVRIYGDRPTRFDRSAVGSGGRVGDLPVVMAMELETKGKKQVNVHYMNVPVPYVVEENFGGYFHSHDDLAWAEELQNQNIGFTAFLLAKVELDCMESMYLSFQRNVHSDTSEDSSSAGSGLHNDHNKSMGESNSSGTARFESQLADDEAFARELQELENQLADTSLGEITKIEASKDHVTPAQSSTANAEHNSASPSSQVAREDDIDPDSMSYEELQQLGETIGAESRGLSDELISLLQSSTYKTGLFSRKDKSEKCVICCMAYKNRDKLIKLPCQHQYHKVCITKWLKINKHYFFWSVKDIMHVQCAVKKFSALEQTHARGVIVR
ncbi:Zinc finger, C3HC4 type (RING finger) [Musa troglodytarum]|uniref:Zinc finger, C3HC4 type (RING finger) n=1 Tax=Musa troglodytarum TaxID=320322 RepID=A0A9E7FKH0_9LILI|nr:Zinc finger, C3HC4 type (RING finger) [Musa troglodytarum]